MRHAVLITRPIEESLSLAKKVEAIGCEAIICPLLDIVPRDIDYSLEGIDVVAITSRNTVSIAKDKLAQFKGSIMAVGASTAAQLKPLSSNIEVAGGNVDSLYNLILTKTKGRSLRVVHLAGNPTVGKLVERLTESGIRAEEVTLYDAKELRFFPSSVINQLETAPLSAALFFSRKSAEAFVSCMQALSDSPDLSNTVAIVLTDTIKSTLDCLYFGSVVAAEHPSEESVLKKLTESLG